ncbi:MAG TPA: cytochrome c oxidase subunit 4 [Hanamia sp.]
MDDEEIAKEKLKKIAGAKDLSTAIEKLERKKEAIEDDFKDRAHHLFENLNPITVLDHTLQNVKKSSSTKYTLFKKALAFGAGYLSKRKLAHQVKNAFINTFKRAISGSNPDLKADTYNPKEVENNSKLTDNKKENNYMNSQIEKVKAKPEVLPEPTYWPFFLAMGLAFLGWGLLTTWLISLAGFIILIISLIGWINILRHE